MGRVHRKNQRISTSNRAKPKKLTAEKLWNKQRWTIKKKSPVNVSAHTEQHASTHPSITKDTSLFSIFALLFWTTPILTHILESTNENLDKQWNDGRNGTSKHTTEVVRNAFTRPSPSPSPNRFVGITYLFCRFTRHGNFT